MSLSGVKICRIASIPYFLVSQLKEQGEYLSEQGMKVNMVSSDGPEITSLVNCKIIHKIIDIRRKIDIKHDLIALIKLIIYFKKNKFGIVHSSTPKAGLLTAIAGFVAKTPIVLHTFTGQQWINERGIVYYVSKLSDRIIGFLNTRCYADSESQMLFILNECLIKKDKIKVIGFGSLAGVNMDRFNPSKYSIVEKTQLKNGLSVTDDTIVIIFIGRITKDKGVLELLRAFTKLRANLEKNIAILIVGPREESNDDAVEEEISSLLETIGVHCVGYTESPEDYLAVSDILCLPSYREGFGTVVIEAAAMMVPTVGTTINGLIDAVEKGVTGLLIPVKNEEALYNALVNLINNPVRREKMGKMARIRCKSNFDSNFVNSLVASEYKNLLSDRL